MVVDDFHLVRVAPIENEAQAPLVIDPGCVLSAPFAAEHMQAVSRWRSHVVNVSARIKLIEQDQRPPDHVRREPTRLTV